MSIIIIDKKSGQKVNKLTGEIIYGPTAGSLQFGTGKATSYQRGNDLAIRSFKSNMGLRVTLEDHELSDNPHIAFDRLAQKYNDTYGHVDTVDASQMVLETHYAGQNQELDPAMRLPPPEDKNHYTQEDIDYLEFQNGYNFHEDGPEETHVVERDGLRDLEGPGSVANLMEEAWDYHIKPIFEAQLENPDLTKQLQQDNSKREYQAVADHRKRVDAHLDKHPEKAELIDRYNKHMDTTAISEYDVVVPPKIENTLTLSHTARKSIEDKIAAKQQDKLAA